MLVELNVRDLGVISDLSLAFGPGMCAVTGETGAGKTMIVEALSLLLGSKPDPSRVRSGAAEASVEGLFLHQGEEVVVRRVVPAAGRSRSYLNGQLATAAQLSDLGHQLVEITGQHAHQRLSSPAAQRHLLDRVGEVPVEDLAAARDAERAIRSQLDALGGDDRTRAREIDLLRYQLDEIDRAAVTGPDEDSELSDEEDRLSSAASYRAAAVGAIDSLAGDGGAVDVLNRVVASLDGASAFEDHVGRLRAQIAEVSDVASEMRGVHEQIEESPERLDEVRARRHQLVELRRKYGDTLAEVMEFSEVARRRLDELESHAERAAALQDELERCEAAVAAAAQVVAAARHRAATELSGLVSARLGEVAMAGASFEVGVLGDPPCDDVRFLLAANRGLDAVGLSSGASGGELSRTMLALYLVTNTDVETTVFDEIDAGVGGEAAVAIGRALASLSVERQVIVVTHLPQVAAFADTQVAVIKSGGDIAVSSVAVLDADERVIELSRMLSGSPDSDSARSHAGELLDLAHADRAGR